MTEDVGSRARRRAAEAHQRALEAGARAAELAAGDTKVDDEAVARSRGALDRAAQLAKEGYRNAADAERAAARAHDAVADSLEQRAQRNPEEREELEARARNHRREAQGHRDAALLDEERLAALD
jgi:hypothetical protein